MSNDVTEWRDAKRADRRADRQEDRADRQAERKFKVEQERARAEERRKDAEAKAKQEKQRRAEQAKEKEQARQRRKAARAKVLASVTDHIPIAGVPVVAVSMVMAVGGQMDAAMAVGFGGFSFLVPLLLEGLTYTLVGLTSAAMHAKRPHASLMAWAWGSAILAAAINAYGHMLETLPGSDEPAPGVGVKATVFAIASLAGVALWWRCATANTKRSTKAERAEERARAKQRRNRRRKFKPVAKRADEILAAHPFGTITEEKAWEQAWLDVHAMPVSRTARSVKTFQDAEAVAESLSAAALRRDFRAGVDGWLKEVLDDGSGGAVKVGSESPSGSPSEGATALGRKGKRVLGRKAPKTPDKPLAKADLTTVRKLADALGGVDKLSARNVREAIGGGAQDYAVRLRDAVKAEQSEK